MTWHPVASLADVPPRHVAHTELLGHELAVWQADDGHVNVWQNQCPHRGVRLSLGVNDGHELRCRYHAWRYANRTGGCTYIPAHPGDAPAPALCARTHPSIVAHGLVWTSLDGDDGMPPDVSAGAASMVLRGVPFDAPAATVVGALRGYRFQRVGAFDGEAATITVTGSGPLTVQLRAEDGDGASTATFFVHPVDYHHCVVRGVLAPSPDDGDRLAALLHHDARLSDLREAVESAVEVDAPWGEVADSVEAPAASPSRRRGEIPVVVRRRWASAQGIAAFELAPVEGDLPTVQPGAHIDVHLPGGLVRQYSLVNGPGEQDVYRIGVKREPLSTGGSRALHDAVRQGDVLAVSAPRANFVLRRDAFRTVLLAGGIGATPLLAMAQALQTFGAAYELHLFVQTEGDVAFPEIVDRLGAAVVRHVGLDAHGTAAAIERILGPFEPGWQVYLCGPAPMLERARAVAAAAGWPDAAVHYEYFKNTRVIDTASSFDVELARSGLVLAVPAGRSILDVVREHGVMVDSSCEQGACGTCVVGVLEGEPDHQDVYLNPQEHADGRRMTICVSRARSVRLVLDL